MNTKMSKLVVAMAAMVMAGGAWAADNATATATANVVTPISVAKNTDMSFGKFYASGTAGTVTLSTKSERSATDGATLVTTSSGTAAVFTVTGTGNSTFTIDTVTGSSTVLTNGTSANDMSIDWTTEAVSGTGAAQGVTAGNDATTGTLSGGSAKIYAGGVLTVAADQPAGTYTGSLKVTVAYN